MDLAFPTLVTYLATINPNEQIRVLLLKGAEGSLKTGKPSKKSKNPEKQIEKEVLIYVQYPVPTDATKEVVLSK